MSLAAIAAPAAVRAHEAPRPSAAASADPRGAARSFRDSIPWIESAMSYRQIGSEAVLNDIQGGVKAFGRGVDGAWGASLAQPSLLSADDRHNLLVDLKNLAVFEGAARVAFQRTGYMDVPREQHDKLFNAVHSARTAADLLERA